MTATTPKSDFTPVIMSGGSGTRLWPISRTVFPKQMCDFLGESLLEGTLRRLTPLGQPMILTTKILGLDSARALKGSLGDERLILEPFSKNTAPAIALLCRYFQLHGWTDRVVGVFPADHYVKNEKDFVTAVEFAASCAAEGAIVTLGIQPDRAATGFGYIETSSTVVKTLGELKAMRVSGFREKPDEATAQKFIDQGGFYWNAGIFVFRVSRLIEHFKALMPALWSAMETVNADLSNLETVYSVLKSESFDYGIMEKLADQVCVPARIEWSDLGSWDDIARLTEAHILPKGNNRATTVMSGATGVYAYSDKAKAIAVVGVSDIVVVDTSDAILVARRGSTQDVRSVVSQLSESLPTAVNQHKFELRPWGKFEILSDDTHYKAKRITLLPGCQIFVSKTFEALGALDDRARSGEVTLEGESILVRPGVHVHIPVETKHRIRNTSNETLEFIEVQTGTYFGEDDIIRYSDDYGRV